MRVIHIDHGPIVGDGVGARREDGDSLSYTYYIGFLKIATRFFRNRGDFQLNKYDCRHDMNWWRRADGHPPLSSSYTLSPYLATYLLI